MGRRVEKKSVPMSSVFQNLTRRDFCRGIPAAIASLSIDRLYLAGIVIAVGACAISGGPYIDHAEVHNGADSVVPVDLYIAAYTDPAWTPKKRLSLALPSSTKSSTAT